MTRLVGEIHAGHEERRRFVRDIKDNVAAMRASFRAANEERARTVRQILLKKVADDLAGAHKAWFGTMTAAMPGRTRRGGKWSGGESA
jgi:adenylyl- and sulfurtransferase ThiI